MVDAPMTPGERTVTDATGRKLVVREIDVVEQLDLYELAGEQSTNPAWLGTAMTVASVRSIDGTPRPFPTDRQALKGELKLIGQAGLRAIRADRDAQEAAEMAKARAGGQDAGDIEEAVAKN